jgi:hypothetical protein
MNAFRTLRRIAAALAAVMMVVPFASPSRAADDVSETRNISGFERVRMQGAFKTEIVAGEHRTSVVITGKRDEISRVTTDVRDGVLVVGVRGAGIFSGAPKVKITLPVLRGFENEGASSTTISGLTGGDIDIANAGAASIVATGRAARENITLNGTGKIDATGVAAHDVTVSNNGLGGVYVRANGALTLSVNGVGEIRYSGNPTHVTSSINGVGRISRM